MAEKGKEKKLDVELQDSHTPENYKKVKLKDSQKNANYGTVGSFNRLVWADRYDERDTVTLSFYSQKTNAPGQIMKFSAEDFKAFQKLVSRQFRSKNKKQTVE